MKQSISLAVTSLAGVAIVGLPISASAMASTPDMTKTLTYIANLNSLNDSGATGVAHLSLRGKTMTVSIDANGLLPGYTHDQHIHGSLDGSSATCPTMAQDVNKDGYVSVREGAANYGPIKVNLTKPQTPFGTPPDPTLFAPYAGMDNMAGFPMANSDGSEHFHETYSFNLSDESAAAAYKGVMPLEAQDIVIHGAMAPTNVDTLKTTSEKIVYDDLLPVACGEVVATGTEMTPSPSMTPTPSPLPTTMPQSGNTASVVQSFVTKFNMLTDTYNQMKTVEPQMARDMYVHDFYDARNILVDGLNQTGATMTRDQVSTQYQMMLENNIR
jgi:hypothetical protein